MKYILSALVVFFLASCKDPSSIVIENNLSKAIILNAEWGGEPIAAQLIPGESSDKIEFDFYSGFDFPESYAISFYLMVNGDMVYLETKEPVTIGEEENVVFSINDSTKVYNPLLLYEEQ